MNIRSSSESRIYTHSIIAGINPSQICTFISCGDTSHLVWFKHIFYSSQDMIEDQAEQKAICLALSFWSHDGPWDSLLQSRKVAIWPLKLVHKESLVYFETIERWLWCGDLSLTDHLYLVPSCSHTWSTSKKSPFCVSYVCGTSIFIPACCLFSFYTA